MTAYTDFHYSPTGSGVISGAQVLEQTEQGINGLGQYVQDNVSGAIDTANEALTTARSADSNATTAINLANSFNAQIIAANQNASNALTTAQSAQNTANAASSLATTADNNAATALNAANSASAGVTTLTGTVNSLGNRMTAAENAINTNAGNITTLQNNLATTNANVTAAANAANAAQATATSAQATATLARNQAYVLRYTGTTITGGGTIAYADIDNTDNIKAGDKIIDISGAIYDIASVDIANQTVTVGASPVINLFCDAENLIPAANDAYDLGSSGYQWNNLYAKNYYYNGVAWGLDKANVWDQVQTISYSGVPTIRYIHPSLDIGSAPASDCGMHLNFCDAGTNVVSAFQYIKGSGVSRISIFLSTKNSNNQIIEKTLRLQTNQEGTNWDFYPSSNGEINLGTTTSKWKTLNGINPGALSLPDVSDGDPISTVGWSLTGARNTYIPTENGWFFIRVKGTASAKCSLNIHSGSYNDNYPTWVSYNDPTISLSTSLVVPAQKSVNLYVYIVAAEIEQLIFFPCLGNV